MGNYIENDIKFEYTSIFEESGVETLIRDSIIGGNEALCSMTVGSSLKSRTFLQIIHKKQI